MPLPSFSKGSHQPLYQRAGNSLRGAPVAGAEVMAVAAEGLADPANLQMPLVTVTEDPELGALSTAYSKA